MSKTIGWESWEDIGIGLFHVINCPQCNRLYYYNGRTPRYCQEGHLLSEPKTVVKSDP